MNSDFIVYVASGVVFLLILLWFSLRSKRKKTELLEENRPDALEVQDAEPLASRQQTPSISVPPPPDTALPKEPENLVQRAPRDLQPHTESARPSLPKISRGLESRLEPKPPTVAKVVPTPQTSPEVETLSAPVPPITTPVEAAPMRDGLTNTRKGLLAKVGDLFRSRRALDPNVLDALEEALISADVGVKTTMKIVDELRQEFTKGKVTNVEDAWLHLRNKALALLNTNFAKSAATIARPQVIMVIGVNGSGKTTTIGKLSRYLKNQNKKVVLAAGDTFRAAAVAQLEGWGRRVNVDVVSGKENADPASVVFDAIRKGIADSADFIIIDTAGRLHTDSPLMDELKKMHRTIEKALGRPADDVWLVLDATIGQNALHQARVFTQALPVTGLCMTKLDGSAKGGIVLCIVDELNIPVRYIGLGERAEDLHLFDAGQFVDAMLPINIKASTQAA